MSWLFNWSGGGSSATAPLPNSRTPTFQPVATSSTSQVSRANVACTSLIVTTASGKKLHARSMEFMQMPMKSVITFHASGEQCQSTAPGNSNPPGLTWTSKYGYAGVSIFGAGIVDGMNPEGLSCSFNSLDCTEYQTVPPNANSQALELFDVGGWLLGNFATVAEAVSALKGVYVWGKLFPPLGQIPGLHIALHDKTGDSAVIEYLNGNLAVVSPNPVGVMTNDPPFPWHLINLSNYNYVTPNPAPNIVYNGYTIPAMGPGSGMPLPGGYDSVSRFVKIMKIVQYALPTAKNSREAANQAIHILNNVDKPYGVCVWPVEGKTVPEFTRWCVIKDVAEGDFYYYSHKDLVLKVIHLSKMNLSPGQTYPDIPVEGGEQFEIDVTPKELIKV